MKNRYVYYDAKKLNLVISNIKLPYSEEEGTWYESSNGSIYFYIGVL